MEAAESPRTATADVRAASLLRIAGHPVELFSEEPKECKAATSPFSRRVWLKNRGEGGWSEGLGEGLWGREAQGLRESLPGTLRSTTHLKDKTPGKD